MDLAYVMQNSGAALDPLQAPWCAPRHNIAAIHELREHSRVHGVQGIVCVAAEANDGGGGGPQLRCRLCMRQGNALLSGVRALTRPLCARQPFVALTEDVGIQAPVAQANCRCQPAQAPSDNSYVYKQHPCGGRWECAGFGKP